jgi:hypothetical protein
VAGLAQPETNKPAPRVATKAKRQALRASIFKLLMGDSERQPALEGDPRRDPAAFQ